MGKKATFIKARLNEFHRKKVSRGKRSEEIRKKRLGTDSSRLVQRVLAKRPLPVLHDQVLLLDQFGQSCRLPVPAEDLVNLVKSLGDEGGNRDTVKAVVEKFCGLAQSDRALFHQLLTDENATRIIAAATSSEDVAKSFASSHKALCNEILSSFEKEPTLVRHHVASRVFTSIVLGTGSHELDRVFRLLEAAVTSFDDAIKMVKDRHVATTLCRLLSLPGSKVSDWLSALLKIGPSSEKPVKRSRTEAAIQGNNGSDALRSVIEDIMDDPIGAPVLHALITDANRLSIFSALVQLSSTTTKRSQRFVMRLLEVGGEGKSELATQLLDEILLGPGSELIGSIVDASFDANMNFTVQKVIKLIPRADRAAAFHRRVLDLVSSRLFDMSTHPIAVHVVIALIDASHAMGEKGAFVAAIGESICRPESVVDLIRNTNGGLVVRKLIETSSQTSSASTLLMTTIEQHMSSLIFDATGNHIVQELLRSGSATSAGSFFRRYLKGEALLSASQHLCASHVVHTLFDRVDPPTFAEMCGTLKPHVCNLARHVNGRFVVEKMIASQRDVRESLVRQFIPLSMSKGTQHLLVSLFEHLDNGSKNTLLQNVVLPHFRQLAVNGTSSIVLQKLLQGNPFFLAAVKKWASSQGDGLLRELSQNFFGKFVVQIITNWK